jgi:hypothetical protein
MEVEVSKICVSFAGYLTESLLWSSANDDSTEEEERERGKFRKLRIMFVFGAEMCTGHNSMLYLAPHINRKQLITQRTI